MERYFLPSVPPDLDLRLSFFDNPGGGVIHDPSFCRAVIRKVETILQAVEENWGRTFVWSDIDVQFFRPFSELVRQLDADLAFQVDAPGPALCSGFFFCRASEQTRVLWQNVLEFVRSPESRGDDQLRVRNLIGRDCALRVRYLPPTFMGGGTFTGQIWVPGDDLHIPQNIIVHHANFTIGVANKIEQCELVRAKLRAGQCVSYDVACELTRTPWLFRSPNCTLV
jgi:hypothetical protein